MAVVALGVAAIAVVAWPDPDGEALERARMALRHGGSNPGSGPPDFQLPRRLLPRLLDDLIGPDTVRERLDTVAYRVLSQAAYQKVGLEINGENRRFLDTFLVRRTQDSRDAVPILVGRWPSVPADRKFLVIAVVGELADGRDHECLRVLLEAASDGDSVLRRYSAAGLATYEANDPAARDAMRRLESDQVSTVREAVAVARLKAGSPGTP